MRKNPTNRFMFDEKHTRRVRDAFILGILVCIASALVFLIIRITKPTRVVSEQIARSEQRLRELLSTEAELKSTETVLREQPAQDRNAVIDFLQHCRGAEDIPDFQGDHVIAYNDGRRSTCYVPAGEHRFEISAVWTKKPTTATQNQPPANEQEKEKTWVVSLRGNTGYLLEVISDSEAQLLRWELSANRPEFKSRKETILLGDFESAGGIGIRGGPMLYPSQVQTNSGRIAHWEESAKAPPGLQLFNSRWDTKTDSERATEIRITATLFSEGPAHVTATDAVSIIALQRSDVLMPYKGGGKFELRAPK